MALEPPTVAEASGVASVVRSSGQALDAGTRHFMEHRFGHDFSRVRIHTEESAQRTALSLGARAFTTGADVVFAKGQYAPGQAASNWLLAHELAHVVQQGVAVRLGGSGVPGEGRERAPVREHSSAARGMIQPAYFDIGQITVNIDFGDLINVTPDNYVTEIESRFIAYTGAVDAKAIHASLVALTPAQRDWVLHGLDVLQENTQLPRDARLDTVQAVQRLIAHAPSAVGSFTAAGFVAEREALRVSGFLEVALAGHLTDPSAAAVAATRAELNPPTQAPGAPLKQKKFRRRMNAGVRKLLKTFDPANRPTVGTDSLSQLRSIGSEVLDQAKDYFAPLPDAARGSVFGSSPPFAISANIFDTRTLTPSRAERLNYLRNRATMVGRNTKPSAALPDTNIFQDTNFDGKRDRAELEALIMALEQDSVIAAQVDRLNQHTGRQSGAGASTRIGIDPSFDSSKHSACEARWKSVRTLSHEVLHALTHPDFRAASASQGFGQVMLEGFTEVLSTDFFNKRIKPKAGAEPAFKTSMEAGVSSAPCAAPPDATVGYAEAGAAANRILGQIGPERFRAAYFLGRTHLMGV